MSKEGTTFNNKDINISHTSCAGLRGLKISYEELDFPEISTYLTVTQYLTISFKNGTLLSEALLYPTKLTA